MTRQHPHSAQESVPSSPVLVRPSRPQARPRTCHVCRYRYRFIGRCDYCGHLSCGNCILGDGDGDAICTRCQIDPGHRTG